MASNSEKVKKDDFMNLEDAFSVHTMFVQVVVHVDLQVS